EERFLSAWGASRDWTLLVGVRPGSDGGQTGVRPGSDPSLTPACRDSVEAGVQLAARGDLDGAKAVLDGAARACPAASAPLREIAGIHALRRDWREAAVAAQRAVDLDREDAHAWRILATSLFVQGDERGALAAWNRVGEPTVDLLSIHGLQRTRYDVVSRVVG